MSVTTQTLIEEIKTAPESVQREVFDFLVFLKARLNAQGEGAENLLPWRKVPGPPTGTPRRRMRHGAICKRRRGGRAVLVRRPRQRQGSAGSRTRRRYAG